MPTTFLHTADWQLGKPFARVADATKRNRLQDERIECLKRIGALAEKEGADFILVAGDLFDSPTPLNSTVARACEAIGAMKVPVLVIPGNHDHGGPGSLWEQPFFVRQKEQLAPNLQVLLDPVPVVLGKAVIFPAPLLRRQSLGDPCAWIRSAFDAPEFPTDLPRIVLAHGSVQGFDSAQDDEDEESKGLNRIDLSRLPDTEIDFIALGDWHGTKEVGPKALYSGTPEIDRFPKGETNSPGNVLIVKAERGGSPQVQQVETGRFRWHVLEHRFSEDSGFDEFVSETKEAIGQWGQDCLLKISLDGSLGIETSSRLENWLSDLETRLLRVKLENRVAIAPTAEEIAALARRPDDPLISSVASRLIALTQGQNPDVALLALRELHAALH